MEAWKRKLRMGMVGGGQGAFIGWVHRMAAALDQQIDFVAENPNYMEVYKFGEPRRTYTRASGYLSKTALEINRVPTGHPEGYLEAFANIYCDAAEAIRRYIDGNPMKTEEYKFPTVYDGLRGMQFITRAVESCKKDSSWVNM